VNLIATTPRIDCVEVFAETGTYFGGNTVKVTVTAVNSDLGEEV
jgi:hypothetical protein